MSSPLRATSPVRFPHSSPLVLLISHVKEDRIKSPSSINTSQPCISDQCLPVCTIVHYYTLHYGLIASEASFLVCSMARIFSIYIYIGLYISGRTSCRKCSKCFYVYLNIRPVRYSARIESVDKPVFFSTAKKCSATEDCCRNPGGDRRPSSTVKYCSATGLLPNRQRGERPGVNGLPFSHRRKETPVFNNLELLVNPSSTAKKCSATEDCCRNPGGDRHPSSTVKYCSATGLLPNRQRGERPGVNGLPFSVSTCI